MAIIVLVIGLISLVGTGNIIKGLSYVMVHERPVLDRATAIRQEFLNIKDSFSLFTKEQEVDINSAIENLSELIKESEELKDLVEEERKDVVAGFIRSAKRFRVAVINYVDAYEYDPTGSTSIDMEMVAVLAAKETNDALNKMANDIKAKIKAVDINMLIMAKQNQKIIWAGIFTGVAISFFMVFFIGKALSRPILQLLKATQEISKGDVSYRIKVESMDEIGKLAESFNKMSDDLTLYMQKEKESRLIAERRRDELESAYKELDEFTYTISHDLKEPLRTVDAFSKFLEMRYGDKLDDRGKHYIERVRVNASTMQNLIEDLLEISRIDRSKNPVEEIEMDDLIDEVKMRLGGAIDEKKANIIIHNKLPRLSYDRVRLTEVFLNLISNSIKFADKEPPQIDIGCIEKNGFYEFYVKDNGPGIEEQYFDTVFKIFQRLGRREDHEGTGAGLTIVKKIIENNGGRVWIESKVGEGATFYLTVKDKSKERREHDGRS
ncbi:MAG: HAMP domain-containing protein [Candidatus Omnitrophica bacterium]|nr:HAMP domain-containing protein [Candidatus Omnitrophota bacterium]